MDSFDLHLTPAEIGAIPNLTLAYTGDAVFELLVRSRLCRLGKAPGELNAMALSYVSAPAQAEAVKRLFPVLTEEELAVFKRGRNTRVGSIPKGASPEQYHAATGLETLFGWLWLSGAHERISQLFDTAFPTE